MGVRSFNPRINPHRYQSNFLIANQIQLDHTIRYSTSRVLEENFQLEAIAPVVSLQRFILKKEMAAWRTVKAVLFLFLFFVNGVESFIDLEKKNAPKELIEEKALWL